MIYLVTALYCEASPFIKRWKLEKEKGSRRFQVFSNEEEEIRLVITGTGEIAAATAVSSVCTGYGAGKKDFLINIGTCAAILNKKTGNAAEACFVPPGKMYLCNKLTELSTGRTFYPDILYRHAFEEAGVITGALPFVREPAGGCEEIRIQEATGLWEGAGKPDSAEVSGFCGEVSMDEPLLYDIEAAAVYQSGAYFFGPHQMSFLKLVSDCGDPSRVSPGQVEQWMEGAAEPVEDYVNRLKCASYSGKPEAGSVEADGELAERFCADLHCSKVMRDSVLQHIRYGALSGIDYEKVMRGLYDEGKAPCRDKREGKQCFEEFKRRLL